VSQSDLDRLTRALQTDAKLRDEMRHAPDAAAAAKIAAGHGYAITAGEITAFAKSLSDEALGGVSGGLTDDPRRGIPGTIFGPPKR
jgi:predicted ribosomally synthesized peptide with nif11-like leader